MTGTAKQMGKGATPVQAEASAIMELVERFSLYGYSANPAGFRVDTLARLKDRAIGFEVLAKSVEDNSAQVEAVGRFFADLPLRWTEAWNLTAGEKVLLPFDWFFTINQFNGSCAGNCNEEALCQGICEVVERHVCCDIARHRLRTPAIRPESVDHPAVTEMLAKYQSAGIRLFLSDFTMGTGLPTVGVLAYDPATFPDRSELVWTAGTAPDPQKAMSRALTEAAQLGGDFDSGACYVASGLPKFRRLEETAFITGIEPYLDIADLPDLSHDNIRIEVEHCLSALAARNLSVYIIETTDPLLRLPAFYVIIPGTRFLQRAENASAGMFAAKMAAEHFPPGEAIARLSAMEEMVGPAYYISYYLGRSLVLAGDADAALTRFHRALDLNPAIEDRPSIQAAIGQILKERGRYREALAAFEQGLLLDDERTDILNLAGYCHFKLGEHDRAIERFAAILALDPSSAIDYANMAVNYREMGKINQALYYYQQALAIDPTLDFARQHLEEILGK
jgi:ribosomal protein S12 methylthiotransferase accessory factor